MWGDVSGTDISLFWLTAPTGESRGPWWGTEEELVLCVHVPPPSLLLSHFIKKGPLPPAVASPSARESEASESVFHWLNLTA